VQFTTTFRAEPQSALESLEARLQKHNAHAAEIARFMPACSPACRINIPGTGPPHKGA